MSDIVWPTIDKFCVSVLSKYGAKFTVPTFPVIESIFELTEIPWSSVLSKYGDNETLFPPVIDKLFELIANVWLSVFWSVEQTRAVPFQVSLSVPEHVGEFIENCVPAKLNPFPAEYVVLLSIPFDADVILPCASIVILNLYNFLLLLLYLLN